MESGFWKACCTLGIKLYRHETMHHEDEGESARGFILHVLRISIFVSWADLPKGLK